VLLYFFDIDIFLASNCKAFHSVLPLIPYLQLVKNADSCYIPRFCGCRIYRTSSSTHPVVVFRDVVVKEDELAALDDLLEQRTSWYAFKQSVPVNKVVSQVPAKRAIDHILSARELCLSPTLRASPFASAS
jgi:hypothetical protein